MNDNVEQQETEPKRSVKGGCQASVAGVSCPLRPGDIIAITNKHNELDALLEYICQDDFQSFGRLRATTQQNILRLARSTSLDLGDLLPGSFN